MLVKAAAFDPKTVRSEIITSYSLKKHRIVQLNFSSFTIYQQFDDIIYFVSVCAYGARRVSVSLFNIYKHMKGNNPLC